MKRSALKSLPLALVPSRSRAANRQKEPVTVNNYFDGWAQSVAPGVLPHKASGSRRDHDYQERRPLTQGDLNRVSLATVRESSEHRHWPPGVFEKFLRAEVIRNRQH